MAFHKEVHQKVLVVVEQVLLVDVHVDRRVALEVQEFVSQLVFPLLSLQLVVEVVLVVMLMELLLELAGLAVVEQVEQDLVEQVKQELQEQPILAVEVDQQEVDQLTLIQVLVVQE